MTRTSASLFEFFNEHRARHEPLVLATVIDTAGSTYRKPGAQMLISQQGAAAGLLSGGCLEPDLIARTAAVFDSGVPAFANYDMRASDDLIWGIGLGCEGAIRILLTRLDVANDYQPFSYLAECVSHRTPGGYAITISSAEHRTGTVWLAGRSDPPPAVKQLLRAYDGVPRLVRVAGMELFVAGAELPLSLLILGAGPDAMPLVEIAALLGWHVTLVDHRPAYAVPSRFVSARAVVLSAAADMGNAIDLASYSAAVVMSHNLNADQAYLAALARSPIPYIGLLGPAPRRARLLSGLGERRELLVERLYAPVGLDIGAKTPQEIALAIASEITAVISGKCGGSFRVSHEAAQR